MSIRQGLHIMSPFYGSWGRSRFVTIDTTVDPPIRIGQAEDVVYARLHYSDTPGVLTFLDVDELLRKGHLLLLDGLAVLDDADGDVRVDITDDIQVDIVVFLVHLDDVLLAHLVALHPLDQRHAAVQLVQAQVIVDLHGLARGDMI